LAVTWPHVVEDNFLDKRCFDSLLQFYDQKIEDDKFGISKNKVWLDGSKKIEGNLSQKFLLQFHNDHTHKLLAVLKKLAPERIEQIKWLELNLVWTGKNYKYRIHEDTLQKLLSVVVYLYPEKNTGTILYSDNLGSDKKEIKWVQNRALIFAREKGVTWHSYEGDGKATRYALVINLRSDETIE
tara:strand:- start:137 stop:688 length:552 start_codon:yes stop_codon:yes gene_type:complete